MENSPRALLVADWTVDGLSAHLASPRDWPSLACELAPFDQVVQTLLKIGQSGWTPRLDALIVWTRPRSCIRAFASLLDGEPVSVEDALTEVRQFAGLLERAAAHVGEVIVPSWVMPSYDRAHGILNFATTGPSYFLARMNIELAEAVSGTRNIRMLDAARWLALSGAGSSNPKLWYLGKVAFSPEVMRLAAAEIKTTLRAVAGRARKLLVLDLDDTLWGGVVGDVGWRGLKLGGHDPLGESFVTFQRRLKSLTHRGVVLGIVSKNTESVALSAFDAHPEMVLRRSDFAGWRINWRDKAENLVELVREINLGLDAVVFIDDNPAERERIRQALPAVMVPEWPVDKLLYDQTLAELDCFDLATISEEDQRRTRTYVADRERKKSPLETAQSVDEFLATLGLEVTVELLGESNLPRAGQLLNKTNQMNLATRRMNELEFLAWSREPGHAVFVFRVKDRFEVYGLTGLASLAIRDDHSQLVDFVLSCRVMGRGVEQAMLHAIVGQARGSGSQRLVATIVPTDSNAPCREYFANQSGFTRTGSDSFEWDLQATYETPSHLKFTFGSTASSRAGDGMTVT